MQQAPLTPLSLGRPHLHTLKNGRGPLPRVVTGGWPSAHATGAPSLQVKRWSSHGRLPLNDRTSIAEGTAVGTSSHVFENQETSGHRSLSLQNK
jgi:hypothetical protein